MHPDEIWLFICFECSKEHVQTKLAVWFWFV